MYKRIRTISITKKIEVIWNWWIFVSIIGALKPANSVLKAYSVDLGSGGEVITASSQSMKYVHKSTWKILGEEIFHVLSLNKHIIYLQQTGGQKMTNQLTDCVVLSTVGCAEWFFQNTASVSTESPSKHFGYSQCWNWKLFFQSKIWTLEGSKLPSPSV